MVDVTDSKSVGGNTVWVRVPPPAPYRRIRSSSLGMSFLFYFIEKFVKYFSVTVQVRVYRLTVLRISYGMIL